MKPLLSITHPKYLKRLVKELNKEGMVNGFYAPVATFNARCSRARVKGGVIQCFSAACRPMWFEPARNLFTDAYGREICASRKP